MLGRLLPKKTGLFDLFTRQARLAVDGARLLHAMLDDLPKAEEGAARVHAVEHAAAADALARTVEPLAPRMDAARTRTLCRDVKSAERDNDRLLRRATARLFREERDAPALVMWKDIFANVEQA